MIAISIRVILVIGISQRRKNQSCEQSAHFATMQQYLYHTVEVSAQRLFRFNTTLRFYLRKL